MTKQRSLTLPLFLTVAISAAFLVPTLAQAQPASELAGKTYHFGTHPARTNITFVSEADLETIHGVTNTVGGSPSS